MLHITRAFGWMCIGYALCRTRPLDGHASDRVRIGIGILVGCASGRLGLALNIHLAVHRKYFVSHSAFGWICAGYIPSCTESSVTCALHRLCRPLVISLALCREFMTCTRYSVDCASVRLHLALNILLAVPRTGSFSHSAFGWMCLGQALSRTQHLVVRASDTLVSSLPFIGCALGIRLVRTGQVQS